MSKKIIYIIKILSVPFAFFCLTLIYLFPLLQGLILLPLDLLIGNYAPWYSPGTILLKNPYMQDSVVQLFPWRHLVYESLTNGIIPFWNPYQNLGVPFMANPKTMVFYPLNLLFIFGEINAWNMLLFLQIFLSMLFTYYLARDFKLNIFSSIFAALAYGLNSYMIGLLQFGSDAHTMIWWPLIMLCAKRFLDKRNKKYLFFTGITIAFSILAGQLQYFGYFIIFLFVFIIYFGMSLKDRASAYAYLLVSVMLGVGICAVQLLPSIELFMASHRGLLSPVQNHEVFARGLVYPYEHFRLLSPDFFGNPVTRDAKIGYIETSGYFGIIPLFFALIAIILGRKNKYIIFFGMVFIISLLLSLKGIGEILYLLKIPLITSGSGDRIFTMVLLTGSLLAGFGLSEFIESKKQKKHVISMIGFLVVYILIIVNYILFFKLTTEQIIAFLQHIKFSLIIQGIFIAGSVLYIFVHLSLGHRKLLKFAFLIFVLGITFFDLFRFGYRFLTFSNEKFLYPEMKVTNYIQKHSENNLGRTYGLTEPELATYLKIPTVETYNPLYLQRTSVLLQSLQNKSPNEISIDNKYFLTTSGSILKNTLDLLGVKYIVATKDENPGMKYFYSYQFDNEFKKINTDDRYFVYRNLRAYPRFSLYYKSINVNSDSEALKLLTHEGNIARSTIILEESLPFKLEQGTGSARLLSSTINTQKFEVETTSPALFYISDTFYPGWSASVNKQNTKIYRANYNFRAVFIPQGKSVLEFTYMPTTFIPGLLISIVSFLVLLFYTMKSLLSGKQKKI